MASQQQQVAVLLKTLIDRGLETKDAIPTIKSLVEKKIFSLDGLTSSNMPASIPRNIRQKILRNKASSASASKPQAKRRKTIPIVLPKEEEEEKDPTKKNKTILVNRSPVLVLWTTIVAERLFGLSWEEALTIGNALAAQVSKAKGTSLGIYPKKEQTQDNKDDNHQLWYDIMGFRVMAMRTPVGIRGIGNNQEQDPHQTWRLLQRKFGSDLGHVLHSMKKAAAAASSKDELASSAWNYYVHIRPNIPHGTKGWGAHGHLETQNLHNFYTSNNNNAPKINQFFPKQEEEDSKVPAVDK